MSMNVSVRRQLLNCAALGGTIAISLPYLMASQRLAEIASPPGTPPEASGPASSQRKVGSIKIPS